MKPFRSNYRGHPKRILMEEVGSTKVNIIFRIVTNHDMEEGRKVFVQKLFISFMEIPLM